MTRSMSNAQADLELVNQVQKVFKKPHKLKSVLRSTSYTKAPPVEVGQTLLDDASQNKANPQSASVVRTATPGQTLLPDDMGASIVQSKPPSSKSTSGRAKQLMRNRELEKKWSEDIEKTRDDFLDANRLLVDNKMHMETLHSERFDSEREALLLSMKTLGLFSPSLDTEYVKLLELITDLDLEEDDSKLLKFPGRDVIVSEHPKIKTKDVFYDYTKEMSADEKDVSDQELVKNDGEKLDEPMPMHVVEFQEGHETLLQTTVIE